MPRFFTISLLSAAFVFGPAKSGLPLVAVEEELILWPDGVPASGSDSDIRGAKSETLITGEDGLTRRFNVSVPRLIVHRPTPDQNPAANMSPSAAIIVVPGGGFARLADEHEGSDVCKWLTTHGITAFQLIYRTPTNQQLSPVLGPAQDLQQSIIKIRDQAEALQIDPQRIGIIGFSAGGQTALVATGGERLISAADPEEPAEPAWQSNLLLLIYPYQVTNAEGTEIRSDVGLHPGFPPTFIAQAADDATSPAENSTRLFLELRKQKIPAELHLYENGGHGFGMRPRPGAPGSRDWPGPALEWLRLHRFVK